MSSWPARLKRRKAGTSCPCLVALECSLRVKRLPPPEPTQNTHTSEVSWRHSTSRGAPHQLRTVQPPAGRPPGSEMTKTVEDPTSSSTSYPLRSFRLRHPSTTRQPGRLVSRRQPGPPVR